MGHDFLIAMSANHFSKTWQLQLKKPALPFVFECNVPPATSPDQKQTIFSEKTWTMIGPHSPHNPTVHIVWFKLENSRRICFGSSPIINRARCDSSRAECGGGTCRGWPNVEANHVTRSCHVMRVGQHRWAHPPVNPTRREFVSPRSQTVASVGFQSLVHCFIDYHALP